VGTAIATASYLLLAFVHDDPWAIYASTTLLGLGIGFSFAAMANLVVEAVDQRQTGVATGINTIMRTIGGALGAQIAASIIAGSVVLGGLPEESAFTGAFFMSAAGVAAAFLLALAIPARLRPEAPRRAEPAAEYR
jgi:MFS family permease